MPLFGQVWVWSLAGFLVGALLCWLLIVLPARKRVAELARTVTNERDRTRRAEDALAERVHQHVPFDSSAVADPVFESRFDQPTHVEDDRQDDHRQDDHRDSADQPDWRRSVLDGDVDHEADRDDRFEHVDRADYTDQDDHDDHADRVDHNDHADQEVSETELVNRLIAEAAETTTFIPAARLGSPEDAPPDWFQRQQDEARLAEEAEAAAQADLEPEYRPELEIEVEQPGEYAEDAADQRADAVEQADEADGRDDRDDRPEFGTIFTQHTTPIPAEMISRLDDRPARDDALVDDLTGDDPEVRDRYLADDLVDDETDDPDETAEDGQPDHRFGRLDPELADAYDVPEQVQDSTIGGSALDEADQFADDPFRDAPAQHAQNQRHQQFADEPADDGSHAPAAHTAVRDDPFDNARPEPEPAPSWVFDRPAPQYAGYADQAPVSRPPTRSVDAASAGEQTRALQPPAERTNSVLPKRIPAKPQNRTPFGVQTTSSAHPAPPAAPVSTYPAPMTMPPKPDDIRERALFEPIKSADEAAPVRQQPSNRLGRARMGSGGSDGLDPFVAPGPFGAGSAMPLPGGASPSDEYTVKASVTALRYCGPTSPKFDRTVAEVWFRSVEDAERVGFRPLGQ